MRLQLRCVHLFLTVACAALTACSDGPGTPVAPRNVEPLGIARCPCYRVLHNFGSSPNDAMLPANSSLLYNGEIFYGTSAQGGTFGNGTVFSITPSGLERVIYSFEHGQPAGGLTALGGLMYGTATLGGTHWGGYLFNILPNGFQEPVYEFGSTASDARSPGGNLVALNGILYGTSLNGGNAGLGVGTVFGVSPDGIEVLLHNFGTHGDGVQPEGPLVVLNGALYGTTTFGGTHGFGTVFGIRPDGTEWVLHSFDGENGANPGGSMVVVNGVLYGTAGGGGTYQGGLIFRLSTGGTYSIVHSFGNGADGTEPIGLIENDGVLYGTTSYGGTSHAQNKGTLYSLATDGTEIVLHNFGIAGDGGYPNNNPTFVNGSLYGVTYVGGTNNDGAVYEYTP